MEALIFLVREESGGCLPWLNLCWEWGALGDQSSLILHSISKEQSSGQRCPPSFPCNKELRHANGRRNGGS